MKRFLASTRHDSSVLFDSVATDISRSLLYASLLTHIGEGDVAARLTVSHQKSLRLGGVKMSSMWSTL